MTTNQNIDFTVAANTLFEANVTGIYVEAAQMENRNSFKQLVHSAAAYLTKPVSGGEGDEHSESFEPLSLEFFVNQRTGEYIADVDLTVGGPTIWARYESCRDRITLYAAWGSDRIECSTSDCPLIDWIKDLAPAE